MKTGICKIFGEYKFHEGGMGYQEGEIELLQDSRLVGFMSDKNDERSEIKGAHPKLVLGVQTDERRIYLIKTPLKNPFLKPILWELISTAPLLYHGSWIGTNLNWGKIVSPQLMGEFPTMNKEEIIERIKKDCDRSTLENLFLDIKSKFLFDIAGKLGDIGFLTFSRINFS